MAGEGLGGSMTPDEFNEIAERRGWSRRYLAALFDAGTTTVDSWGTGRITVPFRIAEWLRIADRLLAALPPPQPEEWRRLPGRRPRQSREADNAGAAGMRRGARS